MSGTTRWTRVGCFLAALAAGFLLTRQWIPVVALGAYLVLFVVRSFRQPAKSQRPAPRG